MRSAKEIARWPAVLRNWGNQCCEMRVISCSHVAGESCPKHSVHVRINTTTKIPLSFWGSSHCVEARKVCDAAMSSEKRNSQHHHRRRRRTHSNNSRCSTLCQLPAASKLCRLVRRRMRVPFALSGRGDSEKFGACRRRTWPAETAAQRAVCSKLTLALHCIIRRNVRRADINI